MKYALTYVMVTRNKLRFLRRSMSRLLENRRADEEVIVIDGASTDGSVEYLSQLHESRQIDQFVSETDRGEAHALNKGFLRARGTLIKLISDDDIFSYPIIRRCREEMEKCTDIEVANTLGAMPNFEALLTDSRTQYFCPWDYINDYYTWIKTGVPFYFSGLGLMIRRSALANTGLFHTSCGLVDIEFSLRITAGMVNLAWFSGFGFVWMPNSKSNIRAIYGKKEYENEHHRAETFYGRHPTVFDQTWIHHLKGTLRPLVRVARKAYRKEIRKPDHTIPEGWPSEAEIAHAENWLATNASGSFIFERPNKNDMQGWAIGKVRANK